MRNAGLQGLGHRVPQNDTVGEVRLRELVASEAEKQGACDDLEWEGRKVAIELLDGLVIWGRHDRQIITGNSRHAQQRARQTGVVLSSRVKLPGLCVKLLEGTALNRFEHFN